MEFSPEVGDFDQFAILESRLMGYVTSLPQKCSP
jgi:hypothetical protein